MHLLRSKIAETIILPNFLHEYNHELKDEIIACSWEMLDIYYKGVRDQLITNSTIKRLCRKIDQCSYNLLQITPPYLHLQIWLWIGETIEKWIEFAVTDEQYEVAANLKKLMDSEYA